jgi:L-amino acid N-acyltransferase YncA
MRIARSGPDDAPIVRDIYNELIAVSAAIYEYEPRSLETVLDWFAKKEKAGFPVYGAYGDDGSFQGFATYGPFRERPAYRYTIEHSVYVRSGMRGAGTGTALMRFLIDETRGRGYHAMIGGIDSGNAGSLRLHERLGFTEAGRILQAGWKFGRWLDLVFMELVLDGPDAVR